MLAYIILVGVPLLYYCILRSIRNTFHLNKTPYKGSVLKVFFFIYFLMLALRAASVGVDTESYLTKFFNSQYISWSEWVFGRSSEMGFALLTKLISSFTQNEQVYLAVIAAIILLPVAWLYSRESEGPVLTMLLFLVLPMFGMFFSGFRQSIAIAMAVPAYYCVKDKKILRFVLIVLTAMLFHQSAFILFLLYPVYHVRLTRKMLIWIVPMLLLVYAFSDRIFLLLIQMMNDLYQERYSELESTGAISMLLLFVMLLVFSYVFVDESKADDNIIGLRNILVLSVALQCFSTVSSIAMRMNYYFLLFLPLLIPKVIGHASGKYARICKVADVVLCLYFLYYFLNKAYAQESGFLIYPYLPFWEA